MFCSNCGAKMEDTDLFCPECGTKSVNVESSRKAAAPVQKENVFESKAFSAEKAPSSYNAPAGITPAKPLKTTGGTSSFSLIGRFVAAGAGLLAVISMFMTVAYAEAMGIKQSASFMEMLEEGDVAWLFWFALISAVLVIVLQLTNHPKLSLIGCAGMAFTIGIITFAINEVRNNPWGTLLKYGTGYYLYLIATILCIVCAFLVKKVRK